MVAKSLDEEAIFKVAVEIPADDARTAYLSQVCGDDQALLDRVQKLLSAHDESFEFLEPSPASVATAGMVMSSAPVECQIGPYKLREQIGKGGMGVVYIAEQSTPVRRKVALKIIRPGMASRDVVARFDVERQALAMMDHPNIARVFDGGATQSGQPYFVMELVQGLPITEHCDQQRYSTQRRLELFATVCKAVQHAHQRGVIHRDLKPSNIIVAEIDAAAVPKVIDFGVAKAIGQTLTEETVYTKFSQMVGTPLYMSPEQTGLGVVDVDTRSDVYSLGVLLYELLTGKPPFDTETLNQAGFDEMRRIIREQDPPRPSDRVSTLAANSLSTISQQRCSDPRKLSESLRGELDWIVMMALEKDRTRRYESASALAADVQHYLDDDPVIACPPSAGYRLGKFARRNKVMLSFASLASLALLLGAIGLGVGNRLITQQRNTAEAQMKVAEDNFRRAREAVDQYLTNVSENELLNTPSLQPLRKDLLESALKYYKQFIAERADDETLQSELANAYRRVGKITSEMGSIKESLGAHKDALAIRKSLVAKDRDDADHLSELAEEYRFVGELQSLLGDSQVALVSFEEAISLSEKLVAKHSADSAYRFVLAKSYASVGETQRQLGKFVESIEAHERAIDIYNKLGAENPPSLDHRAAMSRSYNSMGVAQSKSGDRKAAISSIRRAVEIMDKLATENPDVLEYQNLLASYYNGLGMLQEEANDQDGAIASFRNGVTIAEKLALENPQVSVYRESLALSYGNLGIAYGRQRKSEEQLDSLTRAAEIIQKLADDHPDVPAHQANLALNYDRLGVAYAQSDRLADAVTATRTSLRIQEELVQQYPNVPGYQERLAVIYNNLGVQLKAAGDRDKAVEAYQMAADLWRSLVDKHGNVPDYQRHLATAFENLANEFRTPEQEKAVQFFDSALELRERLVEDGLDVSRYKLANCLNSLGSLQIEAGKHNQAISSLLRAIEICQELVVKNPRDYDFQLTHFYAFVNAGRACKGTKRLSEVEAAYEKSLSIMEQLSHEHPDVTGNRANLGYYHQFAARLKRDAGKHEEANLAFRRAIDVWKACLNDDPENAEAKRAFRDTVVDRLLTAQRRAEQPIGQSKEE